MGIIIGKYKPRASEIISIPLIKFGIPLSVMGLLLKAGINNDLVKTALIAFVSISLFVLFINFIPTFKKFFPNYSLQLGGLIGNTSFLGIPIAMALLPNNTINYTIGFDLGTTLFAWIFGPYFLQRDNKNLSFLNIRTLASSILNSPASKGIIGVLISYTLNLEKFFGEILWIPTRIVIFLAIIVVGTRLGIILNNKNRLFNSIEKVKFSIFLKLFIFPAFLLVFCKSINLSQTETLAIVLQAGTPSAISTILMAEAYKTNQDTAAKILFITTILSLITIPITTILIKI